jgi:hypothetical protein
MILQPEQTLLSRPTFCNEKFQSNVHPDQYPPIIGPLIVKYLLRKWGI